MAQPKVDFSRKRIGRPYELQEDETQVEYYAKRRHVVESPENLQAYLNNGGSIDDRGLEGETLLHTACQWALESMVPVLLAAGANPEAVDRQWETPLMCTTSHIETTGCARALLDGGALADGLTEDDGSNDGFPTFTSLHQAVDCSNAPLVSLLIERGANPNYPATSDMVTPLHRAASRSDLEVVDALLKGGADPNAKAAFDYTPMHHFCRRGTPAAIMRLLETKPDLNAVAYEPTIFGPRGATLLGETAFNPHQVEIVKLLVAAGADPHKKLPGQWTFAESLNRQRINDCYIMEYLNSVGKLTPAN